MSKPNDVRKSKIKRLTVEQLDGVTGGASAPAGSSAPAASSAPASSVGSSSGVLCW